MLRRARTERRCRKQAEFEHVVFRDTAEPPRPRTSMSLIHTASVPSILSALLLTACVAKDPDSLGDLETGNESGASESTGGSDDGATSEPSGTSAGSESEGSSETGEPDLCPDPALSHYEPSGCPDDSTPILPGAGCYEPCDGPGDACTVGTCSQVQVNPCVCPEGEDCCAACGAIEWLCVEGLPDACEQIVGTTFASIEELECGLTPEGPALCHWSIVFEEDGDYLWQYSDVGQGGTYTCEGGVITVENDPELEVSYAVESGILTWDGVQYVAEPV
jgi:hypothetical protein